MKYGSVSLPRKAAILTGNYVDHFYELYDDEIRLIYDNGCALVIGVEVVFGNTIYGDYILWTGFNDFVTVFITVGSKDEAMKLIQMWEKTTLTLDQCEGGE